MSPRSLRLLLAVMALGASPLIAQPRAGLHLGVNNSWLIMDSGESAWRRGLLAGGWVRFPLSGAVALQLGAYLSEKGGLEAEGGLPGTPALECQCSEVSLKYFEFPLALNFLINRTNPTSGYVAVGGAFGLKRDCKVRGGDLPGEVTCPDSFFDSFEFNPQSTGVYGEGWEVSLLLGGGLELDRGPVILTVDGRLTWGITDALTVHYPGADPGTFRSNLGQNVGIALLAGVAFPLG